MKLLGYDFDILYQPGLNRAPDALSRISPKAELRILSTPTLLDSEMVRREVEQDTKLQLIIAKLKEDSKGVPKFSWEHGRLLYKGRLVISSSSQLTPSLLQLYHDSVMGGHLGYMRTYKQLSNELYWKGIKKRV